MSDFEQGRQAGILEWLEAEMKLLRADVAFIKVNMSESKGAWKVAAVVGGFTGTIISALIVAYLKSNP